LKQKVAWTAGPPFTSAHVTGDFYIKPSGLTGGPAVLNGKLLKITERIDNNTVVVLPVDPVTGIRYQITQASLPSDLVRVDTVRALVTGVYDLPGGSRIENVQRTRQASTPITRVDKNNRIYCAAANFTNPANPTVPGDVVTWSGAVVAQPYSNDGAYRVASVVDKWTLEIVAQDWGPVYLNPDDAAYVGDIVVQSDGRFWKDPFLLLKPAPSGALPATTDNIRVLYLGMNSLKSATDDPAAFVGPGVRYVQEVDANITAAILAIIGPSATSINDYLYGDRTKNLEEIFNEFRLEHWASGRHSTIRPDYINMEPNNVGPTVIVRNTASDESALNLKFQLRNSADTLTLADINAAGFFGSKHTNPYPRSSVWAGYNQSFSLEMKPPDSVGFHTSVVSGVSVLAADTYYYLVTGIGPDGVAVYGPTVSSEEQAVVTTSNNKYVKVWWNPVPGAARYLVFRRAASDPTVWLGHYSDTSAGTPGNSFFEDFGSGWGTSAIDPIAIRSSFPATSTRIQAQTRSWIGTPLAVNGGTTDNATFSVCGPNTGAGKVAAFYRPTGKVFQGTGIQGVGAPLMALDMEDGSDPVNQHIAKFEFKRWGGSWWDLVSDLRVMGSANVSTFNFRDNAGYDDVYIGVDAANGGQLAIQRTAAGSASILASKTYGDFLSMSALSPSRTAKFGIRNAGNFYLDAGASLCPLLVDTSNGRVGIGFSSLDTAPGATLDVRGDGGPASAVLGTVASSGHFLRIRGTSVGAGGVADVIFGEETDASRYVMSLRGDSEDGGVNSFRFLYHSATTFYDVLKSVPASSGAETYTLYLHGTAFRIDTNGTSGRIGNHNFAADSLELHANGSGDRQCYIDFWASAAATDFDARIFRSPAANGNFNIINVGNGSLNISTLGTGGIVLQNNSGVAGSITLAVDGIFYRGVKLYWAGGTDGCFAPMQSGYVSLGAQANKWSQGWLGQVYCGWVMGCDPMTSPIDNYQAVAHGAQNAVLVNCRVPATASPSPGPCPIPADHWGVTTVIHTNGTAIYDVNLDIPIQVNSVVVIATPQVAHIAGRMYYCHTQIISTTQIRVWCKIQIGPALSENTDFDFNILVIGRPNVLPTWP
jgi:hypothetical protein